MNAWFWVLLGFVPGALIAGATNQTPLVIQSADATQLFLLWPVRSVVPPPGATVLARYQLERSADLMNWEAEGNSLEGTNHTLLKVAVGTDSSGRFFRLRTRVALAGASLRRAQLAGADFREGDLAYADLTLADLTAADLRGASLFGTTGFEAGFPRADLRGADLTAADFRGADFSDAQLNGANFFAARLAGANLRTATLTDASLRFAEFASATLFSADLSDADLRGASFADADLRFAALHGTRLDSETTLDEKWRQVWHIVNEGQPGEILTNLDLSFANLEGLKLTNCSFRKGDLSAADVGGTDLRGADFTGANLRFVFWNGSLIDSLTLLTPKARLNWQLVNEVQAGRKLTDADLSSLELFEAGLEGADLRRANLSQSNLIKARLRQADLTRANLSQADLTQADLTGATLTGAQLTGVIFDHTIMPDGSIRGP